MKSLLKAACAAVAVLGIGSAASAPDGESTWERIKRSGDLRFAVFNYAPYFVKDKDTGDYGGARVEMANGVASEFKADLVQVEAPGWSELVSAISTSKVDFADGMQAAPVCATSIDFAGPINWIEWVAANHPGFGGKNWEEYNNPDVKVAVMTGAPYRLLLEKWVPKSSRIQFKELS